MGYGAYLLHMIRYWRQRTLLQRFSLASASTAVALAIVLSAVTVQAIESFAIRDEAQVAAELVLRTIGPLLQPVDFGRTLPPDRRALLDALFHAHGISDRVLRIRLWRADGRLLYSNVPELATLKLPGVALSLFSYGLHEGQVVRIPGPSRVAGLLNRQVPSEPAAASVLRFFVPVVVQGEAKPVAAFEIFYDLTHLQQQLRHTGAIIWTAVPLGILVLYASVFVLVRASSRQLEKQRTDLIAAYLGTYESLASAIDAKDSYTGGHSKNVADLATRLAQAVGLTPSEVQEVRICARLHDVGKIGMPDAILMKPGPLDAKEWQTMRVHAERGYEILRSAPLSESIKMAVLASHERWDGKGYPWGLAGEAIPLMARIVAVADAYEAMTSDRPYRASMRSDEALRRLVREAGGQFDPRMVQTFVTLIAKGQAQGTGPTPSVSR